jgi:drug/metabolite transporter (DMT)-like permease
MMTKDKLLGVSLLILTALFFSINMIAAKFSTQIIPPASLAFYRWLVAFLLLMVFGLHFNKGLFIKFYKHKWPLFMQGVTGIAIAAAFVYKGAEATTGTNIALIYSLSPIFIVLLSLIFFKTYLLPLQYFGIFMSFVGVLVIIFKGDLTHVKTLAFSVGDMWILGAALSWAVYSILLKHYSIDLAPNERFMGVIFFGLLVLLPISAYEHIAASFEFSWRLLALVATVAIIPSVFAYKSYEMVQRKLGVNQAGLVLYITPIINAILASVLLGEKIEIFHYIGGTAVLCGVLITSMHVPKGAT